MKSGLVRSTLAAAVALTLSTILSSGTALAAKKPKTATTGTIKDLESKEIQVDRDPPGEVQPSQAIEQYQRFLDQVTMVEKMLVDEGIILVKFWFSVSDAVQEERFRSRLEDPMRRWKLSETDLFSITRWEDYSKAKDDMFDATDTDFAPWWTIESDDKRDSRLNSIKHLLSQIPYEHREPEKVTIPDRPAANDAERPPRNQTKFVQDHAKTLKRK